MTWPHECASTWRSYANRAREHGSVPLGRVVVGLSRPVRPFLTLCVLKKEDCPYSRKKNVTDCRPH